ncbi:hypothetical protein F2Q69_00039859 [Brassica cretica]|uniref:Uncharacterized protein n=1 Tax=Brassica cretica TaxID=69181 RepID=A0A8S9N6Y7_BRACR|nr:hypothetical protein F2Q69_00039859 [Brassica cretica]
MAVTSSRTRSTASALRSPSSSGFASSTFSSRSSGATWQRPIGREIGLGKVASRLFFFQPSPDSLFSAATALAIASPETSRTNRHPQIDLLPHPTLLGRFKAKRDDFVLIDDLYPSFLGLVAYDVMNRIVVCDESDCRL